MCAAFTVFAQPPNTKDLKLKLENSVYLQESNGTREKVTPWLDFPELHTTGYYKDEKSLKRINEAELAEDYAELDQLLGEYISHFGPENFKRDIQLIWAAGKVKDRLGDTTMALNYYNLGIKNQRKKYTEPQQKRYDSLISPVYNNWVDLEFYYRILEARRKLDTLIPPKGVMLNMGPKVNSDAPEYAPFMHPSDSILIFTSRRDEEIVIDDIYAKQNEDLFFAEKGFIDGTWTFSKKFNSAINSQFNEGSACLSPDGKTLFFTRCDADSGFGSCDLYTADFIGGDFTNIRNLGAKVNSAGWDSHPNISPDGTQLFFTSNREGGFGGSDIYMCQRDSNGIWQQAKNMGPAINTLENEVTPFFHKVNGTLFFSSQGHLRNLGGYDIYKARWLGDHWEEPKNVGPLVNTAGNEYYFSINGQGTRLFYAMAKDRDQREVEQNFDLYSFPIPMEARPDAIVTLKGYLIDSVSKNPITGIVLVIDRDKGIEVTPKLINEYGYFEFDLIANHKYDIYIQGENFLSVKEEVNLESDSTFQVLVESFELDKPFVFENLEFEGNSYELNNTIQPKLDYVVTFLKRYPMFKLDIRGHTDSDGDAKYNFELSHKRAYKIREYITARGALDENQVSAEGFGESRPLVPNDTEEHKRMNRRVEFFVFLDPNYVGDKFLPMLDELDWDDEELYDPEFINNEFEFDWLDEETDWEIEMEDEEDFYLEYDDFGLDSEEELEEELEEDLESLLEVEDDF